MFCVCRDCPAAKSLDKLGKRAWKNFRHDLLAKGQILSPRVLVFSPI